MTVKLCLKMSVGGKFGCRLDLKLGKAAPSGGE